MTVRSYRQVQCDNCERRVLAELPSGVVDCPECGSAITYDFGATTKNAGFVPYWEMHLSAEPIYITSASQLDRECEKKGVHLARPQVQAHEVTRNRGDQNPPTRSDITAWMNDWSNQRRKG